VEEPADHLAAGEKAGMGTQRVLITRARSFTRPADRLLARFFYDAEHQYKRALVYAQRSAELASLADRGPRHLELFAKEVMPAIRAEFP